MKFFCLAVLLLFPAFSHAVDSRYVIVHKGGGRTYWSTMTFSTSDGISWTFFKLSDGSYAIQIQDNVSMTSCSGRGTLFECGDFKVSDEGTVGCGELGDHLLLCRLSLARARVLAAADCIGYMIGGGEDDGEMGQFNPKPEERQSVQGFIASLEGE